MTGYPDLSLLIFAFLLLINHGSCYDHCEEHRCGDNGIRFPFYLIKDKADYSGYPSSFGLSCINKSHTMLELSAVKFSVQRIDYQSQTISINDPEHCLPKQFLKIYQSSNLPSNFGVDPMNSLTFFDCSSADQNLRSRYVNAEKQNLRSCPIVAVTPTGDIVDYGLISCTKLLDVTTDLFGLNLELSYDDNILQLGWSKSKCSMCQSKGMGCKLKNNETNGEIECFNCDERKGVTWMIIASGVMGPVLLVVLIIASFLIYNYYKTKGEDQERVEKFLEDYRSQNPTRFSYADIKRITNGFKEKLGEGAHGAVYKGKLSENIIVAVKILNNTEGDGKEIINEVGTMGKIHHVNVVRLLGFCADGVHRALIYNFFPNGSLQNFISQPDNKQIFLGWEKLEQIALGVAKGIEYLHQGCDQRILHFDINPRNVLLEDNFIPKISDFGLAKLCPKNRSTVFMTAVRGTLGYIAPEVFSRNFGNVSYKSDIYSYGMLLLEMVGGRKNTNTNQETLKVSYPKWVHNLLEEEEDIRIHIESDEDVKIAKKLAIVGLWCIQWNPANRPSMKAVLQMLEGNEDKLKVPPNPFGATRTNATISATDVKSKLELEVIHELE